MKGIEPCPKCGNDETGMPCGPGFKTVAVACPKCGFCGPFKPDPKSALDAWNEIAKSTKKEP